MTRFEVRVPNILNRDCVLVCITAVYLNHGRSDSSRLKLHLKQLLCVCVVKLYIDLMMMFVCECEFDLSFPRVYLSYPLRTPLIIYLKRIFILLIVMPL